MAVSPSSMDRMWFLCQDGSFCLCAHWCLVWRRHFGSISGEAEAGNVCAVGPEVVQPSKVGLQLPTGQLCPQQQGQVAEDKGVQRGWGISKKEIPRAWVLRQGVWDSRAPWYSSSSSSSSFSDLRSDKAAPQRPAAACGPEGRR